MCENCERLAAGARWLVKSDGVEQVPEEESEEEPS